MPEANSTSLTETPPPANPAVSAAGHGLSSAEAARRLRQFGPNTVETGRRFWLFRTLLGLALNPLVLILLAASIISGLVGEAINATLIVLMIVVSLGLDFFQMYRSEQAASKLQSLIALTTRVWRDGRLQEIPVHELVPGDALELRAGDLIPADATLDSASTLMVDEAALTGESLPVEKRPGPGAAGQVFAGTSVVSGVAQATVTATGARTQFGAIARALVERAPVSESERGSRHFGYLIMRTVLGLVLFVFLVNALLKRDPLESFLFALALAVGLTPEFLPMIITVTLSQGAVRMARHQVIVKRLAAIENLGSMDVLCSDKTGTLTRGAIRLQEHVDLHGQANAEVLRWARINSALASGVRSPLDAAILADQPPPTDSLRKRAELPFDFERRRVSVLAECAGAAQIVTKGAPEGIIASSTAVDLPNGVAPFTAELRQAAQATFERLSSAGYHVLGVAHKPAGAPQATLGVADERDLVFSGFLAFVDPPDPSTREMVAQLHAKGVAIKLLTGDSDWSRAPSARRSASPPSASSAATS